MKKLGLFVCVLMLGGAVVAQEGAQATVATSAKTRGHHRNAAVKVASVQQSPEMKKLTDTFPGLWKTSITVEPGVFTPQGGIAHGRANITSGPAGNSLKESFHSYGPLGRMAGFGLTWWDSKAASYRNIWCDNMSPNGCDLTGTGQWEAQNLVFNGSGEMQGKPMKMRNTFSDITPDSFTFTMETSVGDAPMAKVMTIKYERVTPKSAVAPANAAPAQGNDATAPTNPK